MKMLVVKLQSDSKKDAFVAHEFYPIVDETEEHYELSFEMCNPFINSKKFIPREEVNKVKYVEVHSRIDDKEYWFLDAYVYAVVSDDSEKTDVVLSWTHQIRQKALENLKSRNKMLKSAYSSIEKL